jgi:NAD+ synthetase
MVKILVAQINTSVGDFKQNWDKIHLALLFGHEHSCDLVVFPECTTTGYPQKDLLYDDAFIEKNIALQDDIKKQTERFRDMTVVLGCVQRRFDDSHKNILFNSAVVFRNGKFQEVYDKQLLPNYNVFDERRYYVPGDDYPVFRVNDGIFGITICEDIWDNDYDIKPVMGYEKVDFIINLSASPFATKKIAVRKEVLASASRRAGVPILYVNLVGAQDNLIFDGASMIANGDNVEIVADQFKETFSIVQFQDNKLVSCEEPVIELGETEKIYQALVLGVKDYFKKTGFRRALLGISGGIDSAVVAVIAIKALGAENVLGVLMPSQYSSSGSVEDALLLAKNLGIKTITIPIKEILEAFNKKLLPVMEKDIALIPQDKYQSDVTEQNLQARIRGSLLMAMSNDEGRLLLSTGNKSEMSVGYFTMYGDACGGIAVISDVYKTTVYKLAEIMPEIPRNSITKPPSAELKPDQKDTDSLPPYDVLDGILKLYIEKKKSYQGVLEKGYNPETVRKVLKMVDRNEYKRRQAAPGLIISGRDLTVGRRMPIANGFDPEKNV